MFLKKYVGMKASKKSFKVEDLMDSHENGVLWSEPKRGGLVVAQISLLCLTFAGCF